MPGLGEGWGSSHRAGAAVVVKGTSRKGETMAEIRSISTKTQQTLGLHCEEWELSPGRCHCAARDGSFWRDEKPYREAPGCVKSRKVELSFHQPARGLF